jgi:methylated-DNA-[protein]-cysteine S-methyltransferase
MRWCRHDSPLGALLLVGEAGLLQRVELAPREPGALPPGWVADPDAFADARRQLDEYFAGRRRAFTLPLAAAGTPFQQAVWRAVAGIPYGATRTYGQVAAAIDRPRAVRAVGAANGANPLPIVVPCHRVIGQDGTLTGYGGGLARKDALLRLEGWQPPAVQPRLAP